MKADGKNASTPPGARGLLADVAVFEPAPEARATTPGEIQAAARRAAKACEQSRPSGALRPLEKRLARAAAALFAAADSHGGESAGPIHKREHLFRGSIPGLKESLRGPSLRRLPQARGPQVQGQDGEYLPRAFRATEAYLDVCDGRFDRKTFVLFATEFSGGQFLSMAELWALPAFLELGLILRIGRIGEQAEKRSSGPPDKAEDDAKVEAEDEAENDHLERLFSSLNEAQTIDWSRLIESLSPIDRVLAEDPAGAYRRMDEESRRLYRTAVEKLSEGSGAREEEIARRAVELAHWARENYADDRRLAERRGNAGYFLVDAGRRVLAAEIGYRPPLAERVEQAVQRHAEPFYILGIELLTLAVMAFLLSGLPRLSAVLAAIFLLFLPATEAAVGIMNQLSSWLIPPTRLPRLDLSEGIPSELSTLVAVPALLLSEAQTRRLVDDLEVRYLANRDAHLHFALVTDAPDSAEPSSENEKLADLCGTLIRELNAKYAADGQGFFFHFYRPRVFVESEGKWMGFERKRGKVLDLNNLLLGREDRFAAKQGDLSLLGTIRYVITLDADTQLPKDAARRLVGTIAHPLCRAVIDPATNTVVEGYGILQPRVGVSVHSTRQSRLGAIYSGETGFDLYTRASSDVYQDLFGEGSFTGKGIYEVETFQKVLWQRFPHNMLLSHDLLEGSYARAGLVSDVEVIDDYPSHFSAYSRRKHRWARGDWQVAQWLLPRVPSFAGPRVPNPLKFICRWKILDNLRRSLFEMSCVLLLLCGWFFLPGGPLHWTAALVVLLVLPSYCELLLSLLRLSSLRNLGVWWKQAEQSFVASQVWAFLAITFLAHQALAMTDAVVRTLVRLFWTRRRLLDWETAAQAEERTGPRATVDRYLASMPWLAGGLAAALAVVRPEALFVAGPVLALWGGSKQLVAWLDRPPMKPAGALKAEQELWLRGMALRTWGYFRDRCTEEVNWLIPDNVQEDPPVALDRLSPTNLGLLLNARLAAYDFGYLTLAEFAGLTERTLDVARRLERHRGHLFNWYDCRTLAPLPPRFVSSVDSGNLAACLWTLGQACREFSRQPVFQPSLWEGLRDHIRLCAEAARRVGDAAGERQAQGWFAAVEKIAATGDVSGLGRIEEETRHLAEGSVDGRPASPELIRACDETLWRVRAIRRMLASLLPWALPEYRETGQRLGVASSWKTTSLREAPRMAEELGRRLGEDAPAGEGSADSRFGDRLRAAAEESRHLAGRLQKLARRCDAWVREMDFRFLFRRERRLLSIGYDAERDCLHKACYDLMGSEARLATFLAIAKGDIPLDAWFRLARPHTLAEDRRVLLSWSGTMFEYLMPTLWMKTYPDTLLRQTVEAAIDCQRRFGRRFGGLWGISESAHAARDAEGRYGYQAFGVPGLALDPDAATGVLAPYAAFLCLPFAPAAATQNLEDMAARGWVGRYGFYEAADFRAGAAGRPELVRSWMVHHEGMSLLAAANLLAGESSVRRFHRVPAVKGVERTLQEKVPMGVHVAPGPSAKVAAQTSAQVTPQE